MTFYWILLLLVLLLAVLVVQPKRTIVFEYERGLKFRRGRFKGILRPGSYWHSGSSTHIQKIDARPSRIAVAGQEVLSADGVPIKASILATCQVTDPERAVLASDNYQLAIHTELQLALRSIASGLPIEELLRQRAGIGVQLKELAAPRLTTIGIELQDAALRDLTFPGDVKKIFTQVVKARQEGLAALEKARGETAALRNLANAAGMIERNPSLMQLRALQRLAEQPGNTLVLGMQAASGMPIPLRDHPRADLPQPDAEPPETE
jgi:regulator of protease activity HflC (stomatin/prohibitin superfamily)